MRVQIRSIVAALFAIASSALVSADPSHPVLHPNGFGEHSYASWKAQEGLPDSSGTKNQALYLQKMTATTAFTAAVAVIEGFEGLKTSELTGLEFWVRDDSHCGAGAPRFNIRVKPAAGPNQTIFVGCAAMVPGATAVAPNGRTYQQRTIAAPAAAVVGGTIVALSIVFDEGDDVGSGFAFLDNITVQTSSSTSPTHVWTSASDNANE